VFSTAAFQRTDELFLGKKTCFHFLLNMKIFKAQKEEVAKSVLKGVLEKKLLG
jgi:uncharacterized protein (UPF0212 family)